MKSFGLIACAVMAIACWFACFSESVPVSAVHPADVFDADDVRAIFGEMISPVETQSSDKFTAIDKRIGDLEALVASAPKVSSFDSSDLVSRIDSMEAKFPTPFDSSDLDSRVSKIEALVERASKSTRSASIDAKLASFEKSMADLKTQCAPKVSVAAKPVTALQSGGGSTGTFAPNPYTRVATPNDYYPDPSECTVQQPSYAPAQRSITLQRTYQPATQCVNGQCNQVSPSRLLRFR